MCMARQLFGGALLLLFALTAIPRGSFTTALLADAGETSRPVVVNTFALTGTMGWQYGFEETLDTPPTRWNNTTPTRFMGDERVIWFRLRFIVRARPRVPLGIMPGRISNTDRAYLNGQLIGSTGRETSEGGAFGRERLYYLPTELLKIASGPHGDEATVNELTLRVRGLKGESGIIAGPHRAGPLLLLRERARMEALPTLLTAALLFAAAIFLLTGIRGTPAGLLRGRALLSVVLFSGALFLALAGNTSVQDLFTFQWGKRLEFAALLLVFAMLAPALLGIFPAASVASGSEPLTPRRRAVQGLAWLPAILLLPAAGVIALNGDQTVWFTIRERLLNPIALAAGPALALRGFFLFFKRRSSDTLAAGLGPTLLSAAFLLHLLPGFHLYQAPALFLFGAGLLLPALLLPRSDRPQAGQASPELSEQVSEDRQYRAPTPQSGSLPGLDSEFATISVRSPETAPPTVFTGQLRMAGRDYLALIAAFSSKGPVESPTLTRWGLLAVNRPGDPVQAENTFPETWLRANLSEFRHFQGDSQPDTGAPDGFLTLLDPLNGYLYYATVGTPTIEARLSTGKVGPPMETPREIGVYQMQPGERICVRGDNSTESSEEVGQTVEIYRREAKPADNQPDEEARNRMQASLREARRGNRREAVSAYEELHLRYPETESIAQNLALLHIKERNLGRAAQLYEHCARLNPAREKYIYQAALAHYRNKDYARAAALTERLILRNPRNLEGLLLLCELMRLMNHTLQSGELLERARSIAANDPRVAKMSKLMSS